MLHKCACNKWNSNTAYYVPFNRCVNLLFLYGTGIKLRGVLGEDPGPDPGIADRPCCAATMALRDSADNTSPDII